MPTLLALILGAFTVMWSVVAFVSVGLDKRRARQGRWRIRECTLHRWELLGGWPGSWMGRRVFRHKTRDGRYRLVAGGITLLHVSLWSALAWWGL